VNGVSGIFNMATVVVDDQFGVMILAVRYPNDHIYERDGLVVVLEAIGLAYQVVILLPAFKML